MVYNVCAVLGPSQHPYIGHREIHGIWAGPAYETSAAIVSCSRRSRLARRQVFVFWVPYAAPRLQTRTWHVVSVVPVIDLRVRCHSDN